MNIRRKNRSFLGAFALVLCGSEQVFGEVKSLEEFQSLALAYPKFMIDNLWILIAAALVFIMHLGFSTLESEKSRVSVQL